MRIRLLLFGIGIFISTSLEAQSSYIMGKVYNKSTLQITAEAKLILKKDNRYIGKLTADHAGNYWFGPLTSGNYSIWVIHKGFCQLMMHQIQVTAHQSIYLDLGLVEQPVHSNVATESLITEIYNPDYPQRLPVKTMAYETFQSDLNIISDVYNGPEIRIAPKNPVPSPLQENRATHYHESLKALEKTPSMLPYGY